MGNQQPLSAKKKTRSGQAAIEYIMVIVVTAAIFAGVFYAMRQSVFELWVCFLGPRIQSPGGCINLEDCWRSLADPNNPTYIQQMRSTYCPNVTDPSAAAPP